MLNPWMIEIEEHALGFDVYLRLVNQDTGECRGVTLSVDDIAELIEGKESPK